jgi:hypothetical protein
LVGWLFRSEQSRPRQFAWGNSRLGKTAVWVNQYIRSRVVFFASGAFGEPNSARSRLERRLIAAGEAQMAERRFRKAESVGSTPTAGFETSR